MRMHPGTSAERVRSWPPAVQVGHVASELSRAASLLEAGAPEAAFAALLRARELLGVIETDRELPEGWGPPLVDAVRRLARDRLGERDPQVWRALYADLMALTDRPPEPPARS